MTRGLGGHAVRVERDLLGEREVPAEAHWGIHALRAVDNFPVTGTSVGQCRELVVALASVKQAAARTNLELGVLDAARARAIDAACERLRRGEHADQLVVDMVQGGAGTSTNMNVNEVIANIGLDLLGHPRGAYEELHPTDDVNASQSTNDVYPTSLRLALILRAGRLLPVLAELQAAFARKAEEFRTVVKVGRTQLQDAVPMTLGQEFSAFAVMVGEDVDLLREVLPRLHEINLGATAIGTGVAAPPQYADRVCAHLRQVTGLPVVTASNLVEATQDCGAFVHFSGVLRRIAVKLSKIANDLRLLSSGPRSGFAEINLPARQAGSSLMPGKVNPVIPEMVNQVAFQVVGHDVTVTMAAEAGQLQLNAFGPVIGYCTLTSLDLLRTAAHQLTHLCVAGITANAPALRDRTGHSVGLVTVLNPHIGYSASTMIAQEALRTGRSIPDLARELTHLSPAELDDLLLPESLANLET